MHPVLCNSCDFRISRLELTENECGALVNQHFYEWFSDNWQCITKVHEYYCRHPEAVDMRERDLVRLLKAERIPAGDIEIIVSWKDRTSVLVSRLEFDRAEIERFKKAERSVACPRCGTGRLSVPAESWDQFSGRDGDDRTTYWPRSASFDADGTLNMAADGFSGCSHWSGEARIRPDDPGYAFWCWLVVQAEFHRRIYKTELPAIKDEWSRRTGNAL